MGTFSNSFKRELGKNTGKWVSNKVFGDGHSTPHRILTKKNNDTEARRKERESIKKQRDIEKNKIERERLAIQDRKIRQRAKEQRQMMYEREQRRFEKEQLEQERQDLISSNEEYVLAHSNYLEAIQNIHKVEAQKFDLDELIIERNEGNYISTNWREFYHKEESPYDYEDCIMILAVMAAGVDERNSLKGKKYSEKEETTLLSFGKDFGLNEDDSRLYWSFLDLEEEDLEIIFEIVCRRLNEGPIFFRYQAHFFVREMLESTNETGTTGRSKSDLELQFLDKVNEKLNVSAVESLFLTGGLRRFNLSRQTSLYNFKDLLLNDGPSAQFGVIQLNNSMDASLEFNSKYLIAEIEKLNSEIELLNDRPANKDWQTELADIVIKETRIITDINSISEEIKSSIISRFSNKFFSDVINKGYLDFILDYVIAKKSKSVQKSRLEEKSKLLSSEPFLTYSLLVKQISEKQKIIDKKKEILDEFRSRLKDAKKNIENDITKFHNDNRVAWKSFKVKMKSDFDLSENILSCKNGDFSNINSIIEFTDALLFLEEYGCGFQIEAKKNTLNLKISLNTNEVIPREKIELRNKGLEVVEKKIPDSEYNLIVQDFLCSVILRSANELFAAISYLDLFKITVFDNLMNTARGLIEEVMLVEVSIDKTTFSSIQLSNVDPSDALELFNPNMKFSKSTGFKPL